MIMPSSSILQNEDINVAPNLIVCQLFCEKQCADPVGVAGMLSMNVFLIFLL